MTIPRFQPPPGIPVKATDDGAAHEIDVDELRLKKVTVSGALSSATMAVTGAITGASVDTIGRVSGSSVKAGTTELNDFNRVIYGDNAYGTIHLPAGYDVRNINKSGFYDVENPAGGLPGGWYYIQCHMHYNGTWKYLTAKAFGSGNNNTRAYWSIWSGGWRGWEGADLTWGITSMGGWAKAGPLLVQWGVYQAPAGNGTATIAFPYAFSSASVLGTNKGCSVSVAGIPYGSWDANATSSWSHDGAIFSFPYSNPTGANQYQWFAVGVGGGL